MSCSAKSVRLLAVLALCLLIPACKSKINKTNFDKVKAGMSLEDVEKILGKGTKDVGDGSNVAGQFGIAIPSTPTSGGADKYVWESGDKSITAFVREGKVVSVQSSGL